MDHTTNSFNWAQIKGPITTKSPIEVCVVHSSYTILYHQSSSRISLQFYFTSDLGKIKIDSMVQDLGSYYPAMMVCLVLFLLCKIRLRHRHSL